MAASHFSGPVFSATNVCGSLASTATAAGTTTLTSKAAHTQYFTGSTTQTLLMPPALDTTQPTGAVFLPVGYEVVVWNASSGTVTVQDSAAGAIGTVAGGAKKTAILLTNTTAAGTWALL